MCMYTGRGSGGTRIMKYIYDGEAFVGPCGGRVDEREEQRGEGGA